MRTSHSAMGSAYRFWDGHDPQAKASLLKAHVVAPESVGGMAARRLQEGFRFSSHLGHRKYFFVHSIIGSLAEADC